MGIGTFSGAVSDFDATLDERPPRRRSADREPRDQGREPARPPAVARVLRRGAPSRGLLLHRGGPGRRAIASSFEGEITIKGVTQPATLTRHDRRPDDRPVRQRALRPQARDDDRPHRVRDQLERRHAERHQGARRRGHPQGRPLAGEGGVTMRILAISGSLRRDSHNTSLLRAAAELLPAGVELELWEGLREVPPYDQDDDVEPAPPAVAALRAAIDSADAVLIATPEYNSLDPGRAQERARLGLAPAGDERVRQQAGRSDRRERRPLRRACGPRPSSARCSRPWAPASPRSRSRSAAPPRSSTRTGGSLDDEVRELGERSPTRSRAAPGERRGLTDACSLCPALGLGRRVLG